MIGAIIIHNVRIRYVFTGISKISPYSIAFAESTQGKAAVTYGSFQFQGVFNVNFKFFFRYTYKVAFIHVADFIGRKDTGLFYVFTGRGSAFGIFRAGGKAYKQTW